MSSDVWHLELTGSRLQKRDPRDGPEEHEDFMFQLSRLTRLTAAKVAAVAKAQESQDTPQAVMIQVWAWGGISGEEGEEGEDGEEVPGWSMAFQSVAERGQGPSFTEFQPPVFRFRLRLKALQALAAGRTPTPQRARDPEASALERRLASARLRAGALRRKASALRPLCTEAAAQRHGADLAKWRAEVAKLQKEVDELNSRGLVSSVSKESKAPDGPDVTEMQKEPKDIHNLHTIQIFLKTSLLLAFCHFSAPTYGQGCAQLVMTLQLRPAAGNHLEAFALVPLSKSSPLPLSWVASDLTYPCEGGLRRELSVELQIGEQGKMTVMSEMGEGNNIEAMDAYAPKAWLRAHMTRSSTRSAQLGSSQAEEVEEVGEEEADAVVEEELRLPLTLALFLQPLTTKRAEAGKCSQYGLIYMLCADSADSEREPYQKYAQALWREANACFVSAEPLAISLLYILVAACARFHCMLLLDVRTTHP